LQRRAKPSNLGTVGLGWADDAGDVVSQTAALTDRPFAGNFVLAFDQHRRIDQALSAGLRIVSLFWGDPGGYVNSVHDAGGLVMRTVGSVEEARRAVGCGVDIVVAQGDLGAALAIGLGGGLRALAPAAALAVHDRGPLTGRARFIAFGAAAAELIVDKLPSTPSRWSPRGMSGRLVSSATGGHVLGGGPGAAIALAAAVGAAFAGSRLRAKVHGRGPQLLAAVADALSYSLVLTATSSLH
jgi:hypothetical protein